MNAELKRIEIEPIVLYDNDFAVESALLGQRRFQRTEKLGEIAVQRPFITALEQYLVAVAKDNCAKAVPLRFEDPVLARRENFHAFR